MIIKRNKQEQGISLPDKLKEELAHVHFTSHEQVLRRTHPKKMIDRLRNWWNKELEIPVVPLFSISVLILIIGIGGYELVLDDLLLPDGLTQQRELVDTGVGIYWSDVLERAVSRK